MINLINYETANSRLFLLSYLITEW
jgi:hypothetical protein